MEVYPYMLSLREKKNPFFGIHAWAISNSIKRRVKNFLCRKERSLSDGRKGVAESRSKTRDVNR
jgi:hypothetical protein